MILSRSMTRNGWSDWHILGAVGITAVGVIATLGAWADLWHTAIDHGDTSVFVLVPLVMAWLIWVRQERARFCEPVDTWIGPVMVVAGGAAIWIGPKFSIEVLIHIGALAVAVGCLLTVIGRDVFRKFLPVFGALCLLVPIPWTLERTLIAPFTMAIADLSVILYQAVGFDVERVGAALNFAGVSTPIMAVCSAAGLKEIFLVAYGFAFGKPLRSWVRVLILAATPFVAVICQIVGTLLLAWATIAWHVDTSWIDVLTAWMILPVVFLMFIGLTKALTWAAIPVRPYTLARGH